jgi:uncharacterized protein (UPF0261 family)
VLLPDKGFSAYDIAGGPFHDPDANAAFRDELIEQLDSRICVERIDAHINEPACAMRASQLLLDMIQTKRKALT